MSEPTIDIHIQLSKLFGSYKAEWLKSDIFDLFTQPSYFPELVTNRPCIIVGGRGTGKTTVLRGLSYEGQFALGGRKTEDVRHWPYYGLFYRVNSNQVTAFHGAGLEEEAWTRLFAHYINLIMCRLVLDFLLWHQNTTGIPINLGAMARRNVCASLHLDPADSLADLADLLGAALVQFEAHVNNVADGETPKLSLQQAPIDHLVKAVLRLPQFQNKNIFFLLDEYENFLPYQQKVVNTMIKHLEHYSFKVGVRELGLVRETLRSGQPLSSPADFNLIDIAREFEGDRFREFALKVCNQRIARIRFPDDSSVKDIAPLLGSLSEDEEAKLLGVGVLASDVAERLRQALPEEQATSLKAMRPLEMYFLDFWATSQNKSLEDVFAERAGDPEQWSTRYYNHRHALLYTLRKGKRGIRKYYAGWDVFTQPASGNIRYLMELVVKSLTERYRQVESESSANWTRAVSPELQTKVAQAVGEKYLREAPELSNNGGQLMRLLLGLGRVFGVMAAQAHGHAAEVNQFHMSEVHPSQRDEVEALLNTAVAHLVLLRKKGTMLQDVQDTREYDYMVHPIFCAYFEFSYRRKRKMMLSGADLLSLSRNQRNTIRDILKRTDRSDDEEPMPEQLRLFKGYYNVDA